MLKLFRAGVTAFILLLVGLVSANAGSLSLLRAGSAPGGGACVPGTHAAAFLARTTGLSGTETAAYCNLINGLDTDGTYSLLDALYIFATNTTTTANLNLVSTSFTLAQNGSVTFLADHGYTGDGSTGYLDPTYVPSINGISLTQNSESVGVYTTGSRTADNTAVPIGLLGGGGDGYLFIQPKAATSTAFYEANGATFPSAASSNAQGFWVATRTSSTATALYRNGSATPFASSGSDPSQGTPNQALLILAAGGAPSAFDSDQQAAAFWGAGLSSAQYVLMSNRINAYMTALGINVY